LCVLRNITKRGNPDRGPEPGERRRSLSQEVHRTRLPRPEASPRLRMALKEPGLAPEVETGSGPGHTLPPAGGQGRRAQALRTAEACDAHKFVVVR